MKSNLVNKRKLLLGGLFVMLVFSTFLYQPIQASDDDETDDDDEDDDGIHDDEELINERELQIEVDDFEAHIRSRLKTGEVKNEIEIEIETEHEEEDDDEDYGFEIKFRFKHDSDDLDAKLKFKIVVTDILEFIDQDADGIYNESEDILVQTYQLDSFKPFVYQLINDAGTDIHMLVAETTDGVFNASIYMVGEFALIDGNLISPTQVKFDLGIYNFSYLEPNSQLAMKIMLKDKIEDENEDDDDDDADLEEEEEVEEEDETEDEEIGRSSDEMGVQFLDTDITGFFTWFQYANIDGVNTTIESSPVRHDDDNKWIFLNYPRGDIIVHDPKVGVEGVLETTGWLLGSRFWVELPSLSRNELLIVSAITLFALIGLVLVFRRKRIA